MQIPTIAIVAPWNRRGGFVLINASDFDASVHRVFDPNAPAPEPPVEPVIPVTPGPAADTLTTPEPAPAPTPDPVPVATTKGRKPVRARE